MNSGVEPDRTVEHALYDLMRTHAEREHAVLVSYEHLAEQSHDEGRRYLIRLIVDDEIRHHRQITEMLNELQSFVSEIDIRPRPPQVEAHHDPALREATERLLAIEREDAKELRKLRKELRGSKGYEVFPLLVDLMLHDTAKHIEILRFIL